MKKISIIFASVLFALKGCHPAFAYEDIIKKLNNYVSIEVDTSLCKTNTNFDGFYRPGMNRLEFCKTNTNFDGFYRPGMNRLEFCKTNLERNWPTNRHVDVYRKILLHEAVHVAQDCKAGLNNSVLVALNNDIVIPAYVTKKYSKEDALLEAEAFSYWHKGDKALELVDLYCK